MAKAKIPIVIPTGSSNGEDDGGLSGMAIFGIVMGVFAVLWVCAQCTSPRPRQSQPLRKRERRTRNQVLPTYSVPSNTKDAQIKQAECTVVCVMPDDKRMEELPIEETKKDNPIGDIKEETAEKPAVLNQNKEEEMVEEKKKNELDINKGSSNENKTTDGDDTIPRRHSSKHHGRHHHHRHHHHRRRSSQQSDGKHHHHHRHHRHGSHHHQDGDH